MVADALIHPGADFIEAGAQLGGAFGGSAGISLGKLGRLGLRKGCPSLGKLGGCFRGCISTHEVS